MSDPYTDQAKALAGLSAENGLLRVEIERLQSIEKLYKAGTKQWNPVYQEILKERDSLRTEVEQLKSYIRVLVDKDRAAAEIERLRATLQELDDCPNCCSIYKGSPPRSRASEEK